MKLEQGELMIDGKAYQKSLKAPSCREILDACKGQRADRLNKGFTRGQSKRFQNQEFVGFTAAVKTIAEANSYYVNLRSVHIEARHIISACRVPGRDFYANQDYVDDDEHGAGSILLDMLLESQIQNRVIFVVRSYDGSHIGPKRYDLIKQAATSAIDRAPVNTVTGIHDCIWSSEITNQGSTPFKRGAGNTRGGRGGRGGRGERGGGKENNRGRKDRAQLYMSGAIRRPGTPGSPTFAEAVKQMETTAENIEPIPCGLKTTENAVRPEELSVPVS